MKWTKKKLLIRAKKLKALASSSNPHESSLALKKLQEILIKYNLSEDDLYKDEFGRLYFVSQGGDWALSIVISIAKLYFCLVVSNKFNGSQIKYTIIGSETNARIVIEIADAILKSVHSASFYTSCKKSFRVGAAQKIQERCNFLIEEAVKGNLSDEQGEALVIGDMYERILADIERYIYANMNIKEVVGKTLYITNNNSYERGIAFGDKLSIKKEIN